MALQLHDKKFVPFIPYADVSAAIDGLAVKINRDFKDSEDIPVFVCVLTGAIMFCGELMKRLDFNAEFKSIKLSSYEGTSSTGTVREVMGISGDITGRRVVIVEDIVDTGTTIVELKKKLLSLGAAQVKICTMLLKKDVYKQNVPIDYVALEIPNRFIVGFGLDYDELGRNLKDIYVIE